MCNEAKELRHSEKTFVFTGLMLSIIKPFKEKGTNHGDVKPHFFMTKTEQGKMKHTLLAFVGHNKEYLI